MTITPPQAGAAQPLSTAGPSAGAPTDIFVRLLIAEISRQDPTSAIDPSTMVTQLAQLSTVEAVEASRQATQLAAALGLVGRQVTVRDPATGAAVHAQVSGVSMGTSGPMLELSSGESVPFGSLISVP